MGFHAGTLLSLIGAAFSLAFYATFSASSERSLITGFEDSEFDETLASKDERQASVVDVFAAFDVERF